MRCQYILHSPVKIALSEDCFYHCLERNNVVVLFGTLKVQSFILTEVSDCGLLIGSIMQICGARFNLLLNSTLSQPVSIRFFFLINFLLCVKSGRTHPGTEYRVPGMVLGVGNCQS